MKGLGLATAGLGATAATAPVFHDLDEVSSASGGNWKRPWWVKQTDNITMEVDWNTLTRFPEGETMRGSRTKRFEEAGKTEEYNQLRIEGGEITKKGMMENLDGLTLRDQAFNFAGMLNFRAGKTGTFFRSSFLGNQAAPTPESQGVPKWSGTPEQNSRMVRQVLRGLGAMTVGFLELDPATTQKFIYSHQPAYKGEIVFENVDKAYVTTGTNAKYVIPSKARYMIVFTNQESIDSRTTEGHVMGFTPNGRYMRWAQTTDCLSEFLRYIGYEGMGQGVDGLQVNGLGIQPALGTFAGLGEMSRLNRVISPDGHGPVIGVWSVLTDLPLEPTGPIDAGLMRFCQTCMKCHDACGLGAPDGEKEPSWEIKGLYHNPGHRAYFDDQIKCLSWKATPGNCSNGRCFGACPFSKHNSASIHQVIQAMVSFTGIFNGFFRTMDDAFGYGVGEYTGYSNPKAEEIWDIPMMAYGIDSTIGM
jgi:reductive dehalogenase